MSKTFKKRQSYATLVVLIIMFVILSALYLFAESILAELAIARNNKGSAIAFSLADAGVQEAIYRIQYDTATKNTFLLTDTGTTTFSHASPALIGNGSYSVTIANNTRGAATITSTANYSMGLRVARREIKVGVAQATEHNFDDDGAFFSHSAGGESTGDLEFDNAIVNIYGGSIHSGRDISFKASTITAENGVKAERNVNNQQGSVINCNCLIEDDGDPLTPQCSESPGCIYQTVPAPGMPMIDISSTNPVSYKNQAIALGQYYTSENNFYTVTNFNNGSTKTFNGVVYVEGGLKLDGNRTMNMNGVLASSGSIEIGSNNSGSGFDGIINLTRPGANSPTGVITEGSFFINRKGNLTGTGLVYVGFRVDINSSPNEINFTGGMLSRRLYFNARTINLHFDADVVNDTLANPSDTPVIEISHWEEEY